MNAVSTKQQQLARIAKEKRGVAISCINHYLDMDWLKESFRQLRKDGAAGIDGQTKDDYKKDLEQNLEKLIGRAKSGKYKAPPVRRVYIPKGTSGDVRPIGIPTLEDKLLQRGVMMLLEPIFEQSFYEFSFGFRPGRSQHQAINYVRQMIYQTKTNWILEIDISKYFDTINHVTLRELFRRRISDGVIRRLIDKWLKAGVMEDGNLHKIKAGSPQGGVISPILSNIYLHAAMDHWFVKSVQPHSRGHSFMARYADDIIMGFENRDDAERLLHNLPERLKLFSLKLNEEKTRMICFSRPKKNDRPDRNNRPGTFNFLGFTFYWGKTRKGTWAIMEKTAKKNFSSKLKAISEWCSKNRHMKLKLQHEKLSQKLIGHYSYFGITSNFRSLQKFKDNVGKIWYKWLKRRTKRTKSMNWNRMDDLLKIYYPLPPAKIVHSVYKAKP